MSHALKRGTPRFGYGALVVAALAISGCSGLLGENCDGLGFAPGTTERARCEAAQAARQASAQRGAMDTLRSLDAAGIGMR